MDKRAGEPERPRLTRTLMARARSLPSAASSPLHSDCSMARGEPAYSHKPGCNKLFRQQLVNSFDDKSFP